MEGFCDKYIMVYCGISFWVHCFSHWRYSLQF